MVDAIGVDRNLAGMYMPIPSLRPYPKNARTHTKPQIRKISESMRSFGFTNPILIDKANTIIAGHGRVEPAKLIGLEEVPTIRLEGLMPAQVDIVVVEWKIDAKTRLAE